MYILECCDGSYYTGSTSDLELRLQQHHNGEGSKHTKKQLPVRLVYFEEFSWIDDAFYREKQIQGWSRIKKEALMNGWEEELKKAAECMNETHWKNNGGDGFGYAGFVNCVRRPSVCAQPPGGGEENARGWLIILRWLRLWYLRELHSQTFGLCSATERGWAGGMEVISYLYFKLSSWKPKPLEYRFLYGFPCFL